MHFRDDAAQRGIRLAREVRALAYREVGLYGGPDLHDEDAGDDADEHHHDDQFDEGEAALAVHDGLVLQPVRTMGFG